MLDLDCIPGTLAASQESTLREYSVHDSYLENERKNKTERNIRVQEIKI